jgi:hypothetical protein
MVYEDKTRPPERGEYMTDNTRNIGLDRDFSDLSRIQGKIESIITGLQADGWAKDRDDHSELYKEARLQILHDLKKLSDNLTVTLTALVPSFKNGENYYGDDEF